MGVSRPIADLSGTFNSVYKITQDVSGWDRVNVQVVAPIAGTVYIYGSNDANAVLGVQDGNASLAINFNPILATNLATGTTVSTISAAGNYTVPVNAQFLRLQGNPTTGGTIANVYKLLLFNSKEG